MNKKGFTLVELMAVIAILAIIIVIASRSFAGVTDSSNKKMLEIKIDSLKKAAALYGDDNTNIFLVNKCSEYVDFKDYNYCTVITVKDLINTEKVYFETNETDGEGNATVINPVTGESMLNDGIIIYRNNNRVYAHMVKEEEYKELTE